MVLAAGLHAQRALDLLAADAGDVAIRAVKAAELRAAISGGGLEFHGIPQCLANLIKRLAVNYTNRPAQLVVLNGLQTLHVGKALFGEKCGTRQLHFVG